MASNVEMIQGGLGALPDAVKSTTDYNSQYGDASPHEIEASHVLQQIAMGKDPQELANEIIAHRQAGNAPGSWRSGGQGAPAAAPGGLTDTSAPQAPAPQAPAQPAPQQAPDQSINSAFNRIGNPMGKAQPIPNAGLTSGQPQPIPNAIVGEKPKVELLSNQQPIPYGHDAGSIVQSDGTQAVPHRASMEPKVSQPTVTKDQPSPWKPKRDELARVNNTYLEAGKLRKGDAQEKIALESMKLQNELIKQQAKPQRDYEAEKRLQNELDMNRDKAKHTQAIELAGFKAKASRLNLLDTLGSREKVASWMVALGKEGLGMKDAEFKDHLDYLKAALSDADHWKDLAASQKFKDSADKIRVALINGAAGIAEKNPAQMNTPGTKTLAQKMMTVVDDIATIQDEVIRGGGSQPSEQSVEQSSSIQQSSGSFTQPRKINFPPLHPRPASMNQPQAQSPNPITTQQTAQMVKVKNKATGKIKMMPQSAVANGVPSGFEVLP